MIEPIELAIRDGCIVVAQRTDAISDRWQAIWLHPKLFPRLRELLAEVDPQGSMACPHCGRTTPHQHVVDRKGYAVTTSAAPRRGERKNETPLFRAAYPHNSATGVLDPVQHLGMALRRGDVPEAGQEQKSF